VTEVREHWESWIWNDEWTVVAIQDRTGVISVRFVRRLNRQFRIAPERNAPATRTKEPEFA
jgi:hypothetical protein